MNNFSLHTPTEYIFGRHTEERTGALCRKYGAQRVMIIYGGGSVVRSGLLERVRASLAAESLECCELSGVQPNPIDTKVYEGLKQARYFRPDLLLAVGGGSVIDTAKAIAAGYDYDGDFWDFHCKRAEITRALPIGVVLTIPAAGSEGSTSCVITQVSSKIKAGSHSDLLRPKFAVMNPELTFTLPAWQTASGITDMMAHILERYLSNSTGVEIGDRLAEGMLLAIMEVAPRVMANPEDYDARANIMWSGTVAHNGSCSLGRDEDWTSHAMEHEISAEYDATHGAGLAVMFPAFLQYCAEHNPHKVAQLGHRVLGIAPSADLHADALATALQLKAWFHDVLHMPVTFAELGIDSPDLELMNRRLHTLKGEVMHGYVDLDADATMTIYRLAL